MKLERGIHGSDITYYGDPKELLVHLHHVRDFKIGYQFLYTGLGQMEVFEMASEHFFTCPNTLKEQLPNVYDYLMDIYQQDPSNVRNPIIQDISTNT